MVSEPQLSEYCKFIEFLSFGLQAGAQDRLHLSCKLELVLLGCCKEICYILALL